MKRLMILGSLTEFVRLVTLAKEKGIYTVVVDGYKDGPAKACADKFYDLPVTDIEAVAEVCRKENINGIITSFSDLLFECMVKIADLAGIPTYFTPEKLAYYREKPLMKKMFSELGIRSPKHVVLKKDFSDAEAEGLRFPIVTKPVDMYGSRGIFVLDNIDRVREKFDEICQTSKTKEVMIEEYHDGHEFNMMTWVLNGKVQVISIADREKSDSEPELIPVSTRNIYPSRLFSQVYEEARDILQKVADYTGQKDGALSMQFFWKKGEPVSVCEVAGRFLGYEHELIEMASGFSMEELLIDSVYDREALTKMLTEHDPSMPDKSCAVLYFQGKEGRIRDIHSAFEIAARPDVSFSQIFYKEGEEIKHIGGQPYVARYYIEKKDRASLDKLSAEIFQAISVRDENGNELLYQDKLPAYEDAE